MTFNCQAKTILSKSRKATDKQYYYNLDWTITVETLHNPLIRLYTDEETT